MTEILTIQEMAQQYDREWLLIAYTEVDENLNVLRGEVLAHSPSQEEIYKALPLAKGKAVAFEYVGKIPEDLAFIL
jgi:hypothetical protein